MKNQRKQGGQSRLQSLQESITNILVGLGISFLSLYAVFPLVGLQSTHGQNIQVALYFTAISLARSYVLRRLFERRIRRQL